MEFLASCPLGFEKLLAGELRSFGLASVRPLKGSVSFSSNLKGAYRACMYSRLASRILLPLERLEISSPEELYEAAYAIAWEDHIDPSYSFAISARGSSEVFKNSNFAALKLKDAVVDRLRDRCHMRPNIDAHDPDLRLHLVIGKKRLTLSLDLSGTSLHRRTYRIDGLQGEAPLKENLAACILAAGYWYKLCSTKEPIALVDPFCGSGTLAIEAALQALDRAPGLSRSKWGFDFWKAHDLEAWNEIVDEADDRAEASQDRKLYIYASDKDARALKLAQQNAKRAQVLSAIQFKQADISELSGYQDLCREFCSKSLERSDKEHPCIAGGLLVANPPYAERMGSAAELPALYASLSALQKKLNHIAPFNSSFISPDPMLEVLMSKEPSARYEVMNGALPSSILVYEPSAKEVRQQTEKDSMQVAPKMNADNGAEELPQAKELLLEQSLQFEARLKKVFKQRQKWARKQGISAYRIYDADLPDYNFAIDYFEGALADESKVYVQLAEYQAPKHIEEKLVYARLHDALLIVQSVLSIKAEQLVCKTRRRAKGGSQYAQSSSAKQAQKIDKHSSAHSKALHLITQEHGLYFKLNLTQYLDYGLFLDHRDTRAMIKDLAKGKRFLNLFAYTGSVSCHAAAAGARETTSVDLSKTYLSWAQENFALNGLRAQFISTEELCDLEHKKARHKLVQADCVQWIKEMRKTRLRWDLIFCDPPSFSNSARMKNASFDIQRDHLDIMIGITRLLSQEGSAIFSCNLKSFKPDMEALEKAGVAVQDISKKTIPLDFERRQDIHYCYILKRA